jgi:hypothetical protein
MSGWTEVARESARLARKAIRVGPEAAGEALREHLRSMCEAMWKAVREATRQESGRSALLRAHREGRSGGDTANKCDELSPPHKAHPRPRTTIYHIVDGARRLVRYSKCCRSRRLWVNRVDWAMSGSRLLLPS